MKVKYYTLLEKSWVSLLKGDFVNFVGPSQSLVHFQSGPLDVSSSVTW